MTNRLLTAKWGLSLLTFGALLFIASCGGGDDPSGDPQPDPEEPLTFAEVVATGGDVQDTTSLIKSKTPVDSTGNIEDNPETTERVVCVTKTYDVMDGNSKFPLFSAVGEEVIYPGSLLQGKTLKDPIPKPIVVKRAGGAISYNIIAGNKAARVQVDEVTGSKIAQAMNDIIGGADQVPDDFQLEISQIESESELAFNLGISYENFTTNVQADMSFSTDKTYNRLLVKLTQQFYTMRFDLPTSLDEIFDESVTPEDLAKYVQSDNPATFISSVTYGRIFYMLIESTSSRTEMKASINGGYSGVVQEIKVKADISSLESLKDKKITVIAYGGDNSAGFAGVSSIDAIATRLNDSKDINFGKPLSYVVRSVNRPDDIVGTQLATTATEVECTSKGFLPPDSYRELVDLFEDGIGASFNLTGSKIILYNKAGNKYALYDASLGKKGKYIYDFDRGPISVPNAFGPIGAAFRRDANTIFLFNTSGTQYILLKSVNSSFAADITSLGIPATRDFLDCNCRIGDVIKNEPGNTSDHFSNGNTFPFAGDGIDAALEKDEYPEWLFWDGIGVFPFVYYTKSILFSNDGNDGAELEHAVGKGYLWGAKKTTKSLFGSDGLSFDNVGAACKVAFSESSIDYLYFNNEGDQMIIQKGATFTGPYVAN